MACFECESVRKAVVGLRAQIRRLRRPKPKKYAWQKPKAYNYQAVRVAAPREAAAPRPPAGQNRPATLSPQPPPYLDWNIWRDRQHQARLRLIPGDLFIENGHPYIVTGFRYNEIVDCWIPDVNQIQIGIQMIGVQLEPSAPTGTFREYALTQPVADDIIGDQIRTVYLKIASDTWDPRYFCSPAPTQPSR